jgi:pimeloyl-ACP methyl ester carboxylesterase
MLMPPVDVVRRDGVTRGGKEMTSNDDARTETPAKGLISPATPRLSRRRVLQGWGAALRVLGLLGITGFDTPVSVQAHEKEDAMSERHESGRPNIVLVHGAWADGSSWSAVIERLQKAGYTVTAPQFPLTTLADNLARLRQVLAVQSGPTILAGHSYGGQIITALGTDAPHVVGLVYIAAFGLDQGETLGGLLSSGPQPPAIAHLRVDAQGFAWLPQNDFVEHFAADVDREQAKVMYAVQQPISLSAFDDVMGVPAWKSLPSWYLVAKNDEAIPPDAERFFAKRMAATTVEIASSHVAMVSHPDDVTKLIKEAARAVHSGR